jgi:hypothetical protein
MTFGKTGIAAASLGTFLTIWRHAHPAALVIGALSVYVGALGLLRVSSARELSAFFRPSTYSGRPQSVEGLGLR